MVKMVAGEIIPVITVSEKDESSVTVLETLSAQMDNISVLSVGDSSASDCAAVVVEASIQSPMVKPYEGDPICIKVKDVLGITPICGTKTLIYSPLQTFSALFEDASNHFQIKIGEFELMYQDKLDLYELSRIPGELPLTAANMQPSREKEYSVSISGCKKSRRSKPSPRADKDVQDKSNDNKNSTTIIKESDVSHVAAACDIGESAQNKRDFVGLKNMNMTCYLNSVLQSLWFTPEFRNIIYGFFNNNVTPGKKTISRSLQKLFLKMQFSTRESIETEELTSTFGWTNRDTWHQHDAEELCNLLMENLTLEFKDTPLEGVIEALYFGLFTDSVKCLSCSTCNAREAPFLVLPLPIRQFGSRLQNPTLEDAIATFITPELLDGNNQYKCDPCNKSTDAQKGFLFKRLPYILTIQLKRFEFDWNTNRRYKLNDQIIFPMVLDMNPYMDTSESDNTNKGYQKFDVISSNTSASTSPRTNHSRPLVTLQLLEDSVDGSGICPLGASREVVLKALKDMQEKSGANVYQLHAVLVHRGGLHGGHYFAYILDFESFRWYRCDDAYVRKADIADIVACYGGDEDDKEPTSAYMLMYRRFDEQTNSLPMMFDSLPESVKELWKSLEDEEKIAQEEEDLDRNNIKIPVIYRMRGSLSLQMSEMYLLKAASTKQAAYYIFKHFFPDVPDPPLDRIRVSRFDKDLGIIENSFEPCNDDQCITYSLKHPPAITQNEGLILEVIGENEHFHTYSSHDFVFITQVIDITSEDIVRVEELHCSPNFLIGNLRHTVAEKCGFDFNLTRILLHDVEHKCLRPLIMDENVLLEASLLKINYIFVQSVECEDLIQFEEVVRKYINTIEFELEVEDLLCYSQSPSADANMNILDTIDLRIRIDLDQLPYNNGEIQAPQIVTNSTVSTLEIVPIDPDSEMEMLTDVLSPPPVGPVAVTSADQILISDEMVWRSPAAESSTIDVEEPLSSGSESTIVNQDSDTAMLIPIQKRFLIKIRAEPRRTANFRSCAVRVDGEMPIGLLSSYLSTIIETEEHNFILVKIAHNNETEVMDYKMLFDDITPLEKLRLRFTRRLSKGEGRVSISLLNLENTSEHMIAYIGDAVLSGEMTTVDAKEAIISQLADVLLGVDVSICRLRKKVDEKPAKIFRHGSSINSNMIRLHEEELYVQILKEPEEFHENYFSFLIRKWKPSTWDLDKIEEIIIFYDHSEHIANCIRKKLYELTNIPEEEIEICKPDNEFPFDMNPLAVTELLWFPPTEPLKRSLYIYNDDLTLFVRNKSEVLKQWTADEERTFRKEMNTENFKAISSPRKEVELKIKMKSP